MASPVQTQAGTVTGRDGCMAAHGAQDGILAPNWACPWLQVVNEMSMGWLMGACQRANKEQGGDSPRGIGGCAAGGMRDACIGHGFAQEQRREE